MQKLTSIASGTRVLSPGGRPLVVDAVFVPKHDASNGRRVPSRFRHLSRKLVVFADGSMAPLAEIKAYYQAAG
ncbi:MAG: hypothetical protein COA42_20680 [Alteromonadaceae bacterium]|nr:MAG: hypothetical protein COA42_20680 [Alteromonadaceae bacterium]